MVKCIYRKKFRIQPMSEAKSILLKDGTKLIYASEGMIGEGLNSGGGNLVVSRTDGHSDLEAGIYEGGFKVWECAVDLCNFLCRGTELAGIDVLELGCGAALPSILALSKGASSVCVQDFNDFVIETFTKRNFALNGADPAKCAFVAGEWGNELLGQIGPRKFDLILASETIYNESNYEPFHRMVQSLLAPDGKLLLAAKSYYFGVGGSIPSFTEFVLAQGIFRLVEEVWSTKNSAIGRKILSISRGNK